MSIGERGPKGDHGQEGHDGYTGRPGVQGERGPKGDHGQIGEQGLQGSQGEPGKPGESIGMLGFISRHAIALTFLLVLAATSYGFQQSANARDRIHREAQASELRSCRLDQKSWDQRHAIIVTLTEPSILNPALLNLPKVQVEPLTLQIAQANRRKATQRSALVKLNAKRPRC